MSIALIGADKKLPYYVAQLKKYPALAFIVKLGAVTPLAYHYIGGLRHLVRAISA